MTDAKRGALGVTDFMVRIVLTPEKEPTKVAINWLALPVEEDRIRRIPEYKIAKLVRNWLELNNLRN